MPATRLPTDATGPDDARDPEPRSGVPTTDRWFSGLLIDWGGVLTAPLDSAMTNWASADGVSYEHFRDVMRRWVGSHPPANGGPPLQAAEAVADPGQAGRSPVHLLERGELAPEEFEHLLAGELSSLGSTVQAGGLLRRMLGGLDELDGAMVGMVRRARAAGLRTALLSNSWGDHYPEQVWDGLFDAIVISGRVGMRKPEAQIFTHTADLLELAPEQCVMIDDLPHNVAGAVAAGMAGVLHHEYDQTVVELEALFGIDLH